MGVLMDKDGNLDHEGEAICEAINDTIKVMVEGHFEVVKEVLMETTAEVKTNFYHDADLYLSYVSGNITQLQEDQEAAAKLIALLTQELVNSCKTDSERRALINRITKAAQEGSHDSHSDDYSAGAPDAHDQNLKSVKSAQESVVGQLHKRMVELTEAEDPVVRGAVRALSRQKAFAKA